MVCSGFCPILPLVVSSYFGWEYPSENKLLPFSVISKIIQKFLSSLYHEFQARLQMMIAYLKDGMRVLHHVGLAVFTFKEVSISNTIKRRKII